MVLCGLDSGGCARMQCEYGTQMPGSVVLLPRCFDGNYNSVCAKQENQT
jgi:hypothetical protein